MSDQCINKSILISEQSLLTANVLIESFQQFRELLTAYINQMKVYV